MHLQRKIGFLQSLGVLTLFADCKCEVTQERFRRSLNALETKWWRVLRTWSISRRSTMWTVRNRAEKSMARNNQAGQLGCRWKPFTLRSQISAIFRTLSPFTFPLGSSFVFKSRFYLIRSGARLICVRLSSSVNQC